MKTPLFYVLLWLCPLAIHSQTGPGGVTANLRLWLKADQGTNTNVSGGTVSSWADADAASNNPVINGTPLYATGESPLFNYNPFIQFTGGAYLSHSGLCTGIGNGELFYVLRCASSASSTPLQELHSFDGAGGLGSSFPFTDGKLYDDFGASGVLIASLFLKSFTPVNDITVPFVYHSSNTGSTLSHVSSAYVNGLLMYSKNEGLTVPIYPVNSTFFKGDYSAATTAALENNCAEIILYASELSASERRAVYSYLAIKYGITFDQSGANNYTASNGTVTWNAAANSAYNNNIIGIGRDDASGLLQKQACSVNAGNSGSLLSISLGPLASSNQANTSSVVSDKSYFINGDNLMALTGSSMVTKPAGIYTRLQRVWKCQATNFSQNVSVGFESTMLTAFTPISNLKLLTDDDGDFSNATVEAAPAMMNGTRIEFQNISGLGNGSKQFMTLASADMSTPLPLTLLYFKAACRGPRVQLEWATASGGNCDHFTIERSANGIDFTALKELKPGGDPLQEHTYQADDENPGMGHWYYRLKQTDQSATSSYSPLVYQEGCASNGTEVSFYPNPSGNGQEVHWVLREDNSKPLNFRVYDAYGALCEALDAAVGQSTGTIDISMYTKGLYFVEVSGLSKKQIFKIQKE